jgi:hypothetical protein
LVLVTPQVWVLLALTWIKDSGWVEVACRGEAGSEGAGDTGSSPQPRIPATRKGARSRPRLRLSGRTGPRRDGRFGRCGLESIGLNMVTPGQEEPQFCPVRSSGCQVMVPPAFPPETAPLSLPWRPFRSATRSGRSRLRSFCRDSPSYHEPKGRGMGWAGLLTRKVLRPELAQTGYLGADA